MSSVRIANCSGFYGDRLGAAREMVEGGPIDVLTGDWLAELTMLILAKDRLKDPGAGFAKTFVTQVEQVLGECLERGIRIVANAGGLNPAGCAEAVRQVARQLGLSPIVAHIEGDDVLHRLGDLGELAHLDTGQVLGDRQALTANAYLGGWGIVEALTRGADIVITGRTTDAAIVCAPAAWHHGWARDDWDALAGAVVAGHVIECGTQATGGNYSFFTEVPGLEHPGFPIAEIAADGSSVITKHPGHGGLVSVGTVTAQLLYEISGPRYLNPDVTARFDSIMLEQVGADRVALTGVRGEAPPTTSKVCINLVSGTKATLSFPLVGLDVAAKAELLERTLAPVLAGFTETSVDLIRSDHEDPSRNETAVAEVLITLKDADPAKFGRPLRSAVTDLALATYPGFYAGPATQQVYGTYWPTLMPSDGLVQRIVIDGETSEVAPTLATATEARVAAVEVPSYEIRACERVPLGRVAGARSGDKGGNANLGVWVRSPAAYAWLAQELTVERLRSLMPFETEGLEVVRHDFPLLCAVNFVIAGLLGEGVASSTRPDAQAKSLGEFLRAKVVDVPVELL